MYTIIGASKYLICTVQESPAINEFKIGGLASYICKREKSHKSNVAVKVIQKI